MIKRILAVVVIMCIILTGCANDKVETVKYVTMIAVEDEENTWELRYYVEKGGKAAIYKDNKLYKKNVADGVAEQAMDLYEIKEYDKIKIEDFKTDEPFVYSLGLEQSSTYVKQLKDSGYKQVRKVCTPTSVDVYLKKDNETIRVIAMNSSAVIGSVQNELCSVMEYFN